MIHSYARLRKGYRSNRHKDAIRSLGLAYKESIRRTPNCPDGMIERHQAIVKERAGGGESFVIEAGAAANPASCSRRAGTLERPIPFRQIGEVVSSNLPYCHRSHIETDKPKSVRFFKLILGWRHRRTSVSLYKKFMPSAFFRIDLLCHPAYHAAVHTPDRVTTGVEMSIPSNIAKRGKPAAGIHVCNSSLGRMK